MQEDSSMTGIMSAPRLRSIACALILASLAGCGSGGNAHPADPDQAQTVLRTALDAWKAGEKQESLENRTPPIHVKDVDWRDGFVLVRYDAEREGRLAGYDMSYHVVLELKSPKGKSLKKDAIYMVTTSPTLLISRSEG
jgi:hypothetical protein